MKRLFNLNLLSHFSIWKIHHHQVLLKLGVPHLQL
ncbi:unnamed protein product [Acanthoscelides obtectus]|uniref:Uncharacterized protein n=1 Tax=Acanthoscelides obtectus TaxID=200917 RepID=A0A9P0P8M8_ACAOB|nr:unnamed protein product [Acanthoscelides obtectus]CAK1633454.1 hypothetical protein AOBTE_LOCUS8148 [Acanthoscelides obtectus]